MDASEYETLREQRPELYFPAWWALSDYWQNWLEPKSAEEVITRRVARLLGREIVPGVDNVESMPDNEFNLT